MIQRDTHALQSQYGLFRKPDHQRSFYHVSPCFRYRYILIV